MSMVVFTMKRVDTKYERFVYRLWAPVKFLTFMSVFFVIVNMYQIGIRIGPKSDNPTNFL